MIINGELQTGLGGGVCQVSTTVFNAAYEAGLQITARTNHALYISHYPQGRDATVNYPDIDLKFVNDTGHWLLLRTFVGSSSLVGRPLRDAARTGASRARRRRSSSDRCRRQATSPTRRSRRARQVDRGVRLAAALDQRAPARLRAGGKLLYDNTWYSSLPRRGASRPRRDEAATKTRADDEHDDDRRDRPGRAAPTPTTPPAPPAR